MHSIQADRFDDAWFGVLKALVSHGQAVDRREWQAMTDKGDYTSFFEVPHVVIETKVGAHEGVWANETKPNLPWAEDHFQERISGKPYNPPPSHEYWPYAQQSNAETRDASGKFSHTYPERFWPWQAVEAAESGEPRGIRFRLGEFDDLLDLVRARPLTRQAYLPIWFPEDLTAAREGERVPCTLGYHFICEPTKYGELRMTCTYFMRSLDFLRYFRDDAYMAGRLLQTVAAAAGAEPYKLVMHMANVHVFANEAVHIDRMYKDEQQLRLNRAFA